MESEKPLAEEEVSNFLNHSSSTELDALPDKNIVGENSELKHKSLTHIKKVRFSDVVSESYEDDYDEESSFEVDKTLEFGDNNEHSLSILEDQCSGFTQDDDDVERSSFEEKGELMLSSPEIKGFGTQYDFENSANKSTEKEDIFNYEETDVLLSDQLQNESSHLIETPLTFSVESTDDKVYEENRISSGKDIVKEIASISIDNNSFINLDTQFDDFDDSENVKNINEKLENTLLNRKKSDEKLELQKQSEKINTLLEPYRHKFLTVTEKKSVVFEAWNSVKKKEIKYAVKQQIKEEKSSPCPKVTHKDVQTTRRKIKIRKKKKNELNNETKVLLNNAQRMSKEDMEEKEMAFKSWKKNKDEIIKRLAKIDCEKKQQQKFSILRNEQDKKETAESAYLSWKSHKKEMSKNDRMKKNWLKQKDNEAKELKIQQNERALELYSIWLTNKLHKTSNFISFEDRPAWLPPGKAKST